MSLINLLVLILLLVIVFNLLGGASGVRRIFGGAAKKKSIKKPTKKVEKAKSEKAKLDDETKTRDSGAPYEVTESEACIERARKGEKTVVARLQSPYFENMKPGDHITLKSKEGDSVVKTIVSKHKYDSFKEMFEKEGLENVFPGSPSLDAAIKHYRDFYSEEQEKERGVIALRLK